MIVLDASAMLAYLFREPGHERVGAMLDESCMSAVNLSEVIARFVRDGHSSADALRHIVNSPVEVVPFLAEDAALAAALVMRTREYGLSLGDRACLALAMTRKMPAYTADRAWQAVDLDVEILLIRP